MVRTEYCVILMCYFKFIGQWKGYIDNQPIAMANIIRISMVNCFSKFKWTIMKEGKLQLVPNHLIEAAMIRNERKQQTPT